MGDGRGQCSDPGSAGWTGRGHHRPPKASDWPCDVVVQLARGPTWGEGQDQGPCSVAQGVSTLCLPPGTGAAQAPGLPDAVGNPPDQGQQGRAGTSEASRGPRWPRTHGSGSGANNPHPGEVVALGHGRQVGLGKAGQTQRGSAGLPGLRLERGQPAAQPGSPCPGRDTCPEGGCEPACGAPAGRLSMRSSSAWAARTPSPRPHRTGCMSSWGPTPGSLSPREFEKRTWRPRCR